MGFTSPVFSHPQGITVYAPFVVEGKKEEREECLSQANVGEEELRNGDASLCINHARNLDNSHKLGTSFMDG